MVNKAGQQEWGHHTKEENEKGELQWFERKSGEQKQIEIYWEKLNDFKSNCPGKYTIILYKQKIYEEK